MSWWKETNVSDDDVTWLVLTNLTGQNVVVAECQFEDHAAAIIRDHESAPDLLEALEGVALGHMKTHPDGHLVVLTAETWDHVRIAIAKARGTS